MSAASQRGVLCVSWLSSLASTRELVLRKAGIDVVSACGREEAEAACQSVAAKLLVLGQSVPRDEKRRFIRMFRQACSAPVLSLLYQHQSKLPEADYGAALEDPAELVTTVREILGDEDREFNGPI